MTSPRSAVGTYVDMVASFWKGVLSLGTGQRFDSYAALRDLDACIAAGATLAADLADRLSLTGGGELPTQTVDASTWTGTMNVLPTVTQRPLTLRCGGLRAIGMGPAVQVPGRYVSFDPPVLQERDRDFKVTVSFPTATSKTLIYAGDVTSVETSTPVSDPVHANNRDGGAGG